MNGVEIGKYIRKKLENNVAQIVYISSKKSYAMELFENRPFDFLIKPLTEEAIKKVLNNLFKCIWRQRIVFYISKKQVNI